MRCDRSWSVFVLCVIGRLFAWPSALYAQEVTDLLNAAHEQYEQSLEEIERDAITRLDELIDQYSDEGNLKKVLELRAQKTKLLEDRNWPESVVFRSMRAKIRSSRVRAKRELADAYEDAIATLTKERRYDDAVALQEELEQLTEIQEEFDFRSEEPQQKKPEKDADDPKPEDESPAKSPVKAKAPRPAPPQKRVTGKASGSGLFAALAAEAARTPLVDPLATSDQKSEAVSKLVEAFYRSLPPQRWTPSQFDEFAKFLGDAAAKAEEGFILPQLGSSDSPFGVIPGLWTTGDDIKGHSGMQWLVSSPTPEEFISRATHLRKKDFWPSVDEAADADNLKVWFRTVGCKDAKSVAMLIGKFRKTGIELSAFDVIDKEVGSGVASTDNKLPASDRDPPTLPSATSGDGNVPSEGFPNDNDDSAGADGTITGDSSQKQTAMPTDSPETKKPSKPARKTQARPARGLSPLMTKTFDYSTNNGICNVGEGEQKFGIMFTGCGANSIYVCSDDPSIKRVATARGVLPGAMFRFVDVDSTSRVYTVDEKQVFLAENEFGYYLIGRIVGVRSAGHGEGADIVLFDYVINQTQGDDRLVAPALR
jgi:hypothetical protein